MSGCFNSSNNFSCTECCSFSVAKYLIHFHSCEEVHTEDKLAKFPITSPPVCIIRWLIRMLRFCQCSWLLNFWFVFWHTVSGIHQAFLLCALVFATLLTFGQHAVGRLGQGEHSFWEIPTIPAAYGHCLHSTHPTILHPPNRQSNPSYLHHLTLEKGLKHDCNCIQT